MLSNASYDELVKLIIIGDSNVGKTSIVRRFCQNSYQTTLKTTIGLQYMQKILLINQSKVLIQIWDTSGQQRYKSLTPSYFRSIMGILLVFSVDDRNSFNSIAVWFKLIEQYAYPDIPILLISNKGDLIRKQVSLKQSEILAEIYKIDLIITSSKDNINIQQAIIRLYNKIIKLSKNINNNNIKLNNNLFQLKNYCSC